MTRRALLVATLLGAASVPLPGQAAPGRLELAPSTGYFTIRGRDLSGVKDAWGYEVALRYRVWRFALLEVGGHLSDHPYGGAQPMAIRALYVQPTVRLTSPWAAIQPFAGFRYATVQRDSRIPGYKNTGAGYGLIAGVHLHLSRWIALDGGVSVTRLKFKSFFSSTSPFAVNPTAPPPDRGHSVGTHLGLALHLPWLGR